ncbi:MAG TPA: response regulator [Nitrospirota bacterium]|nr:response regulator [Nitrospirota bacterium]
MPDILIIDDDANFLDNLREGLQQYSPRFDIIHVNCRKKATEALRTIRVDVIIIDENMLDKEDFELLGQLRILQNSFPFMQVILLSTCRQIHVEESPMHIRFMRYQKQALAINDIARASLALV